MLRGKHADGCWPAGHGYGGGGVRVCSDHALTAEQTAPSYSAGTPALAYTYTRLGQLDTVRDATAANSSDLRDFVYDGIIRRDRCVWVVASG